MHKVKIVLSSYDKFTGFADFEVTLQNLEVCSCHAIVDWIDFYNGELNIDPYAWFDHNDDSMDKPKSFGNYKMHLLNDCFEKNAKDWVYGEQ